MCSRGNVPKSIVVSHLLPVEAHCCHDVRYLERDILEARKLTSLWNNYLYLFWYQVLETPTQNITTTYSYQSVDIRDCSTTCSQVMANLSWKSSRGKRGLKCLCVLCRNQRRGDDVFTPWSMWIMWLTIFSQIISKIRANCLTHYYHTVRVPPARNTSALLFLPGIKGVFMLGSALFGRNFATKLFPKHWLRSTWKSEYLVYLKHTVGVNLILLKLSDLFLNYCPG